MTFRENLTQYINTHIGIIVTINYLITKFISIFEV